VDQVWKRISGLEELTTTPPSHQTDRYTHHTMGGFTCAECDKTVLRRGKGWQYLPILGTHYCPTCVVALEAEDAERDAAEECACKACSCPRHSDWADEDVCENCQDKAADEMDKAGLDFDDDAEINAWALKNTTAYTTAYIELCAAVEAARCDAIARGFESNSLW
jgi:hypothetical protein